MPFGDVCKGFGFNVAACMQGATLMRSFSYSIRDKKMGVIMNAGPMFFGCVACLLVMA